MKELLRPNIPIGTHPIEDLGSKYTILTPPIEKMFKAVADWVDRRFIGGMIYGGQRYGKTRAIMYLVEDLPKCFSNQLACFHIPEMELPPSPGNFYSHFLYCVGHSLDKGTVAAKHKRLIEYLHYLYDYTKIKRFVFFIDEAQMLTFLQYQILISIQNFLERKGICSTTLLVGQPELTDIRRNFERGRKMEIIGRFMTKEFEFHGIQTVDDLRTCLSRYDDNSDYPPNSGWSYTRYYFPQAYQFEWRLAHEAEKIWESFSDVRSINKLPVEEEVPMESVSKTVEYLLRASRTENPEFIGFTKQQCKTAVEASGYVELSRHIKYPKYQTS